MAKVSYEVWKKEMEKMLEDQLAMLVKMVNAIEEEPTKIGLLAEPIIDKIQKLKENYALYEMGTKLRGHLVYQMADGQPSIQSQRRIKARLKDRNSSEEKLSEKLKETLKEEFE